MQRQSTMMVEFGVGELLETIAEDDDAAVIGYLQIEFDVPVTENVVIPMVRLLLLLFSKENKFFFVFSFVGTRIRQLFESAFLCPVIAEFVSPTRR